LSRGKSGSSPPTNNPGSKLLITVAICCRIGSASAFRRSPSVAKTTRRRSLVPLVGSRAAQTWMISSTSSWIVI
jgi:hypothetical protein